MNKKLLDRVLEQIVKDVESGDLTAIAELIADIPDDKAIHFLPEEEHSDMNKSDTELHGLIDLVVDQIKQDLSKAITAKETEMDDTELHGGGFTWNYRIVNAKSENGGEDWYCLREVCYDMQGKPTGYGAPCLGSESMEGMRNVWDMMGEAMELPPMQEEDFA